MPKPEKVTAVAELTERFQATNGAVLTEYRGLTVAQLAELRRSLDGHATFAVVKNTLTKIAAKDAGVAEEVSSLLEGPSAIAFIQGDVVEAAKGLREFAKANPALVIKGGLIDRKRMAPAEIDRLADLEPREVLLAMLAGAMKATTTRAAGTFAALPTQMARLAAAYAAARQEAGETVPSAAGATESPDGAVVAEAPDGAEATNSHDSTPDAAAPADGAGEESSSQPTEG